MQSSAATGNLAHQVFRAVLLILALFAFQFPAHAAASNIELAIEKFVRPAYGAFHEASAK